MAAESSGEAEESLESRAGEEGAAARKCANICF